jgi:hypothetical protein
MSKKIIEVLPHRVFDEQCEKLKLDDSNVENMADTAFISIIGTKDCLKYYLDEEDTKHWFNENHSNVINLDFDDLPCDEIEWKGHTFKGMSMEQAQQLFEFIENNIDKSFKIHCRAGFSRSQGVGNFINDFYKGEFESDTLLPHPNKEVYRKLSRCYYKKYRPDYE